jgi:hypothetical protein
MKEKRMTNRWSIPIRLAVSLSSLTACTALPKTVSRLKASTPATMARRTRR